MKGTKKGDLDVKFVCYCSLSLVSSSLFSLVVKLIYTQHILVCDRASEI